MLFHLMYLGRIMFFGKDNLFKLIDYVTFFEFNVILQYQDISVKGLKKS